MAYNVIPGYHILSAVSMGGNILSHAQEVLLQDNTGIQLIWTGSPVGVFSIQVSTSYQQTPNGNVLVPGTWSDLPLSSVISAAGSADNAYIDINQLGANWYRIVYTRTSGTGSLDAYISQKGV